MKLPLTRARAAALLLAGALLPAFAAPVRAQSNAPIAVLSTVAVKGALNQLGQLYEKNTGRKVAITYGAAAALGQAGATGDGFDVIITNVAAVDGFAKSGAVAADSEAVVGTSIASLVYKDGTPKPDISTPDALKAVVLAAKSISFSDPAAGGASSVYFAGVVARLGIGDAVMQKAILTKVGEGALPVGEGRAQYAVAQTSEYSVIPGLDGVPIFPADPKSTSTFAAAVSSKSTQPDAARAFIRLIVSPEGLAIRKSLGLGG